MKRRPKTEEGSAARIVRNSLVNGAGAFSGVLITLFLTPLMIDRLGTDGYGVWVLATSLTFTLGYLSFAELGIEAATVRFIAESRGGGDVEEGRRVLSTGLALFLAVAIVVTPILVAVAGPLAGVFSIPDGLEDDARLTFMIIASQLLFDLPSRSFSGVIQGAQRYGIWQAVELTQITLTAGVFAGVLLLDGGIVELAISSVAIAAFMLVLNLIGALIVAPDVRPSPRLVSRETARRIGGYGGQLILFRIGGLVYRQTDKTIIGITLAASAVTVYEIAFKIQAAAAMVESMAVSALIPAVAFSKAQPEKLREMLTRGTAYAMAASLPVVVSAFVFADPVIRTWIGEGHEESVGPARIFLGVLVLSSMLSVGQAIMSGLGRLKQMLFLAGAWIVLNLALSLALVDPLGVEGVILATLVSQGVTAIPLIRLFLRELDVKAATFVRRVYVPLLPAIVAQTAVSLPLLSVAEDTGSLALVALLALPGVAVFALAYVFVGLQREQRRQLIETARSTFGRDRGTAPEPPLREEIPGGDAPTPTALP